MKPARKLALKKETLAELSSDELRAIVGGESGAPCDITHNNMCRALSNPVCVPTCGPTCTGTSTATIQTD